MHPTQPSPTPPCMPAATAAPRRRPVPRPRPASGGGWHGAAALIGASLLATTMATAAPVAASIFTLDALAGHAHTEARDINEAGHVVGASIETGANSSPRSATFWASGSSAAQALPGLGGISGSSAATGINNQNTVVGGQAAFAVQWKPNAGLVYDAPTGLGSLGTTTHLATGINDAGRVIGTYWKCFAPDCSTGNNRAWQWREATGMQPIGGEGGFETHASALNGAGDILIFTRTLANERGIQIFEANGAEIDIPLAGLVSDQMSMNDQRQIAGTRLVEQASGPSMREGFVWSNGIETLLQPLAGATGAITADINNNGWVVGRSILAGGARAATLWAGGLLFNLNDLLADDAAALWELEDAVAISDSGWIAGNGWFNDPQFGRVERGFSMLLSADFIGGLPPFGWPSGPGGTVSLPGSLSLALLACGLVAGSRRRTATGRR